MALEAVDRVNCMTHPMIGCVQPIYLGSSRRIAYSPTVSNPSPDISPWNFRRKEIKGLQVDPSTNLIDPNIRVKSIARENLILIPDTAVVHTTEDRIYIWESELGNLIHHAHLTLPPRFDQDTIGLLSHLDKKGVHNLITDICKLGLGFALCDRSAALRSEGPVFRSDRILDIGIDHTGPYIRDYPYPNKPDESDDASRRSVEFRPYLYNVTFGTSGQYLMERVIHEDNKIIALAGFETRYDDLDSLYAEFIEAVKAGHDNPSSFRELIDPYIRFEEV